MPQYVTDIQVSVNKVEENKLFNQDFNKIDVDLNSGTKGNPVYLWYKKGQGAPITRVQLTFNNEMGKGLISAGFHKIDKDLNTGAGGDDVFLWFLKGSSPYDVPIVNLKVTIEPEDEAQQFRAGWERLACDLSRGTGQKWIYLWVKREKPTYICEICITDDFASHASLFQDGYIRVDEDTNRRSGGPYIYIWYRQTTDAEQAFNDLQISTNDQEFKSFQKQQYDQVDGDLNKGTKASAVYLWSKKERSGEPIRTVSVIGNTADVPKFELCGVQVISKNLNTGNKGLVQYLCFCY